MYLSYVFDNLLFIDYFLCNRRNIFNINYLPYLVNRYLSTWYMCFHCVMMSQFLWHYETFFPIIIPRRYIRNCFFILAFNAATHFSSWGTNYAWTPKEDKLDFTTEILGEYIRNQEKFSIKKSIILNFNSSFHNRWKIDPLLAQIV